MTTELLEEPVVRTADSVRFSMRNLQLLDGGATMGTLGVAPALWAHWKIYSTGGENAMHSHDIEDHAFFVVQGEATFYFADGSTFIARPFEGVMLPRGTKYRFQANPSGGNLVLFRAGSANVQQAHDLDPQFGIPKEALRSRKDMEGNYAPGDAKKNGVVSQPTVIRPGAFFAPD